MSNPSSAEQEDNPEEMMSPPNTGSSTLLRLNELIVASQSESTQFAALANEDVLEHLVTFLAFEEVKKCRLVNHFWNQVCSKEVGRRSGAIYLWKSEQVADEMTRLISVLDKSWKFPVSKFFVEEGVTQGRLENERVLCTLFEKLAPFVTELTLDDSVDSSKQHFQHSLPSNLKYSCLTRLSVVVSGLEMGPHNNLAFVASILRNAPNLEELHLVEPGANIVTAFVNAMAQASFINLRYLDLEGDLEDAHVIKLQQMGLPLKRLKLEFTYEATISTECLEAFLGSMSDGLVELHLGSYDFKFRGPFQVQFPVMTKLENLNISVSFTEEPTGEKAATTGLSFPGISYAHQFPALKRLKFCNNSVVNLEQFFHKGMKQTTTVLELELPYKFTDPTIILYASRIFPKLIKLAVPSQRRIVDAVLELCKNVEELELQVVEDEPSLDEMLTGYSREKYEQIRNLSEDELEAVEFVPVPFLQKLKVLRLRPEYYRGPLPISNIGCGLVLLRLEALKCLNFTDGIKPVGISDVMMERMKNKFRVLNLNAVTEHEGPD